MRDGFRARAGSALAGFLFDSAEPAPAQRAIDTAGASSPQRSRGAPGTPLVLATATRESGGGPAAAAALGVAAARRSGGGILLVEVGAPARGRGATLLASEAARRLEESVRGARPGLRPCARGNVCWLSVTEPDGEADSPLELLATLREAPLPAELGIVHLRPPLWREALDRPELGAVAGLVRAELPTERALAALAVGELRARGLLARIAHPLGTVGARRALAGLEPGGAAGRRAWRQARGLVRERAEGAAPPRGARIVAERGQALPLVLGAAFALIFAALLLVAIGGAVAGKSRLQRAADLAAVSAARSMRDDLDRLLAPPRLPDGSANPRHLPRSTYLARAEDAARVAARRNGLDADRLSVSFPDAESFAPLRARAKVIARLDTRALIGHKGEGESRPEVVVRATAEASAPSGYSGMPDVATGGGYSGPLAYRQGKPMRPDVAQAFDRLAAAARRDEIALVITSGYRSDAEQARLFAQNPDPRWVAPPGRSLHRCGTELDLGPSSAYAWLAANAPRFGFVKRYSWEPWHFGYDRGPAPCSQASGALGGGADDGRAAGEGGLPGFVSMRFRAPILAAAARWNVSAGLLAAQLMAESSFDPYAVSPAGAQGIAQFMPGTAAAYGLGDPFDVEEAIDAQAHLMSDLLGQFGSVPLALAAYNAGAGAVAGCDCIPPYPETEAYVARILALLDGAGELAVPPLEVRLVA